MFLMIAAARRLWSGHHHHHHGHAHMPSPSDIPDEITLRQMLSIILSIGIRPCAGAVLVLIFAYILQLRWTGISAVFAMSIGTAITVAGLAALSVYARQVALRLSSRIPEGSARVAALFNIAALLGGLILVLLGVALFKSLQAVAGHPIL
jgi:ABC-type nickel/cobalt efflux system permease component RcnA